MAWPVRCWVVLAALGGHRAASGLCRTSTYAAAGGEDRQCPGLRSASGRHGRKVPAPAQIVGDYYKLARGSDADGVAKLRFGLPERGYELALIHTDRRSNPSSIYTSNSDNAGTLPVPLPIPTLPAVCYPGACSSHWPPPPTSTPLPAHGRGRVPDGSDRRRCRR